MNIDFLLDIFSHNSNKPSIIWNDSFYNYKWLTDAIKKWSELFKNIKIEAGKVIGIQGDFSPNSISLLLSLIDNSNIIVPLTDTSKNNSKRLELSQTELLITINQNDEFSIENFNRKSNHKYYSLLKDKNKPGLVLFTSGTSGEPKVAVHDFSKLLEKFKVARKPMKTINFLLFDHWGGLNTLLHTLSNAGVVFTMADRSPMKVCAYIEKYGIELLPTSPTFLNLLLISEAYKSYDLSSLKLITYGTEPMPQILLHRLKAIFPNIKLQQTYGLIELGVLQSKSQSDDSLWVKIGGKGFDIRVVDGILQIKAESAMLGYLNAPSPFTDDGYFITGDQVEVNGEYFKILGRRSELINVGGEKVYPQEIENVIQEFDNVAEVMVYGEKNAIMGNIVCAKVRLIKLEDKNQFIYKLKKHCNQRLQPYKVPVKIVISEDLLFNERLKKIRAQSN